MKRFFPFHLSLEEKMIYFDHAATTPLDKEVLNKMLPYFTDVFGNADSTHSFGRKAMAGVDLARDGIAKTMGCKPNEIYFTSGGSEGNTWALKSAAEQFKGKKILVSQIEHHSVLTCAEQLKNNGTDVEFLPVDHNGVIRLDVLENACKNNACLVAVMAGNNEVGTLQPVEKISAIAKQNGILFHCDCVQTAGSTTLPIKQADSISFSAHKFNGPKGVGCLYIKNGTKMSPLINGGEQERSLRGGTTNVAGVVGLSYAFCKAQREREQTKAKLLLLRNHFESRLKAEIPCVRIQAEGVERLSGISNVTFFGVEGTALLFRLDLSGIAVSLGSACASGSIGASHVLTAMGMAQKEALSSVRFSFGIENTLEEIDIAIDRLKQIVEEIKR